MADAILSTIAGEILKKLCSCALQEIGLWWGVHDELEKLKKTVTTIEAVLCQAEKQHTLSDQVKNYIEDLKEVLYDADDLLDDFSTEALQQQVMSGNKMAKEVRIFFSRSNQLVYGLKMSHKIKAIRERLDATKAGKVLHIGESSVETQVVTKHRETYSYIGAEEVIGRHDDKIKIIEMLMGSDAADNVSIISIVGIGGLGKTTLAQLVYNDNKVKNHFNLQMWVCVSDVFDVKIIVEDIIKSATRREPGNLNLDQLQDLLRKELEGKKYLLVLDDVWNEDREEWRKLERLFMGGAKGSRIVVTTRSLEVAKITNTVSPHILEGLSKPNSWSLFAKMAFEQGKETTNQNIIAIGKEIVKNCAGVPLAIRMMGSLLYSKKLEEWTYFKIELSKLLPQLKGGIFPTLKLSYNNLEPHLKHCFAYCMLFPKDHKIDVTTLIHLWIAQGLIKPSNLSQSLEQIGYEYFLFLLWRSFFQEPEEDECGNIVSCKMHDLMHDLAIEVAGEESTMISSDEENIPTSTRHVSINHYFDLSQKIPVSLLKANNIRTFLLIEDLSSSSDEEIWSQAIVSKFRRLRMLDLHGLGIKRVSHSIGKLKHLRYLDLSRNYEIEMLPSSITRLQNLLVLKLSYCRKLKELPKEIKKLVSLKILEIDECDSLTHMPQGLGQLTSLEKLTKFIVSSDHSVSKHYGGLNELNRLNNLRGELRLEKLKHVKNAHSEYDAANLKEKEHLQSLRLYWEGDNDVDAMSMEVLQPHRNLKELYVFDYPGVSSPSWLSSLTNLVKLNFLDCPRVKHLPPLDGLSSLQHLSIKCLIDLECIDYGLSSLTNLVNLELEYCERVKHLPPLDGLSSLQHLSIKSLIDLECIDYGLSSLTNLVNLELKDCKRVKHLPPLDGLTSLRHLSIKDLNDLEYIDCNGENCSKATFFSSLEKLEIGYCPNLKGWRILSMETSTTSSSTTALPPFPCLSNLKIHYCNNLTSMPLFPSIEGQLVWQHISGKPLQETMMMKSKAASTSTSSPPLSLSKLNSLWINDVHDLEYLPDQGMQNLTSLESPEILRCHGLLSLAGEGFSGLTSLRSLQIDHCERLKSISGVLQHCTALEKLIIRDCKELDFSDGMQCQGLRSLSYLKILRCHGLLSLAGEGFSGLTSLRSLEIYGCGRLKSISGVLQHCTALEKLNIEDCKELDFSDGMQCQGLRSLSSLEMRNLPQLVSLPKGLQCVTTLKSLQISKCQRLRTLSPVFEHLTALEELQIKECNELELSDVSTQFQNSWSLRFLRLENISKLVSLPEWLQHLTTLQDLSISRCDDLTTLPDWIGNLTSLQNLYIHSCSKLTSLPDGMRRLTSLQQLRILGCPQVSEICKNNKGVDWPKIAHIPNISIDYKLIQHRGCYRLEKEGILHCFYSVASKSKA